MRLLIAALLGAALISFAPAKQSTSDINNIVRIPANVEQARKPAAQEVAPLQEKTPEPVPATNLSEQVAKVETPEPQPLTDKQQLMQAAGIPQSDWAATDYIVSHESSWRHTATNPESGAYGLCQALPKEKMASAGDDYNSNPVTQLKWCHSYAHSRYKGWTFAASFWQASRWW